MDIYNINKLPQLDLYLIEYLKLWYRIVLKPPNDLHIFLKILITLIHIIHLICIILLFLGALLHPKYLKYYILYMLCFITSYAIYDNCIFTKITQAIDKQDYDFMPITKTSQVIFSLILLFWSVIGIYYPKYSLYNLAIKKNCFVCKKFK